MSTSKLYIYDTSSSIDRRQAAGRFSGSSKVTTIGAGSVAELHTKLGECLAQQLSFNRVLFQTHGNSGMIFFNHVAITADTLRSAFGGYRQLFPGRTKMYFDGCNVADGAAGWTFLAAAGEVFLKNGGGITMGYTSLGSGLPGWVPVIGGHTLHLWGDLRFIDFTAGAVEASRFTTDGASMMDLVSAAKSLDSF
jgi:hypothetical protein